LLELLEWLEPRDFVVPSEQKENKDTLEKLEPAD